MLIDEIRAKLDQENQRHDCTQAQRDANQHRLMLYELLTRCKSPSEPSKSLDTIMERLRDGTTYTPNKLLREE